MGAKIKKYALLTILVLALPMMGLGCRNNVEATPITLEYWRVFDNSDALDEIIAAYRVSHPHVTINVRKMRYEEYEQEMLNAWAEDRGPDIFSIHNTWLGEYKSKIAPLPTTVTTIEQSVKDGIRDEIVSEEITKTSITPIEVSRNYVDVVAGDVVRTDGKDKKIFGLPLSVDTLVMFYNRDILNRAGVATPPQNWNDFLAAVSKITQLDNEEKIVVSGAALGTAANIPRFSDILAVLMMQNGAQMTSSTGEATFQMVPPNFSSRSFVPGIEALRFYTDFARPTKNAYSWNNDMPDALEAFMQGRTAFFFGYNYHVPLLRAQAAGLRWEIAALPQADAQNNKVNFANYWVETVSARSKNIDEAWNFVQFAATAEQAPKYLEKTKKPTALRSLVDKQRTDADLQIFAEQLLTAKSWYKGNNVSVAEQALATMIDGVLVADKDIAKIVGVAIKQINETLK